MIRTLNQLKQPIRLQISYPWIFFLGVFTLYALLIVPTLKHQGISWDEEIDLRIARAYLSLRGLFLGLSLDLSQTRLPMFIVALVYRFFNVDDLFTARLVSMAVGGLTILGVYVYGKDRLGQKTGLLAASILAISPFFLSFARIAFTESDIYLACTLIWLLVAVSRLIEKPIIGHALVAGFVLGLAISTKATVLGVLPALWIALLFWGQKSVKDQATGHSAHTSSVKSFPVLLWAGWSILLLLVGVYVSSRLDLGGYPGWFRVINYGLVFLGWSITIIWAFKFRFHSAHPASLAALMTGVGLLTFIIIPPDHLINSNILKSLFSRAENEMSLSAAFMGELAALHLLSIFFKSTPGIGFALLSGAVVSVFQWRRHELMLPLLVGGSYFAGLLLLPLGQTFYTIPILPILSLLAADMIKRLWSKYRRVTLILMTIGSIWWGVEMVQCYPDYNLNGYQWLGERPLFGRSSIGYRSVVYTPSDGIQQVLEWLDANVKPGEAAQLYVGPWHIVRHIAPNPGYHLTNGFDESLLSKPDYVGVDINSIIWHGFGDDTPEGNIFRYPFNIEELQRDYDQVFVVERAFGLEVASIWKRK
jgi:hypothetical protein